MQNCEFVVLYCIPSLGSERWADMRKLEQRTRRMAGTWKKDVVKIQIRDRQESEHGQARDRDKKPSKGVIVSGRNVGRKCGVRAKVPVQRLDKVKSGFWQQNPS